MQIIAKNLVKDEMQHLLTIYLIPLESGRDVSIAEIFTCQNTCSSQLNANYDISTDNFTETREKQMIHFVKNVNHKPIPETR